jgi:hypothetical protein
MKVLPFLLFTAMAFFSNRADAQDATAGDTSITVLPGEASLKNMALLVNEVHVSGNKKTRLFIVMREVPFKKGDQLAGTDLPELLKLTRQQLMNTQLFVDAAVYVALRKGNLVTINIDLKERWYLFPLPYFRLVDRNFNQWWVDQKRSLERVNYGMKFTQNNVSGRNDNLDVWLITGYTQQITLRYELPFFDRRLRNGFNIGFVYATQKEVNYGTGNNKQLFYKQEEVARRTSKIDLTYSYRPDINQRHYFRISYNHESVADTILQINPLYYPNGKREMKYIDFGYQYKYYHVDQVSYPSKGFQLEANLYKRGLDNASNLWLMGGRAVYAVPLAPKTFLHWEGIATLKLPFNDYFFNEKLIGYGFAQMRGLEYNVVDGMAGGMLKSTLHHRLLGFVFKNPFPSKTHDKIPFRIFLKAYGDLGYGYNTRPDPTNTLNNRLLRTWGVGMDIVSIYDFVFKIEYSFNQLGRNGLYLQSRNDF